ncbi:MAG TPA: hypothetical protein VM140_07450 [Burkholderiales bacterium]|nr:hypothetical protein [Burkholderiales bacterium]
MSRAAVFLCLCWFIGAAVAHPVSFPGNLMAMGEVDRDWKEFNAWYTFAPKHAAGPGYMEFRSEDRTRERKIPDVHYNYRASRWNWADAQANIYLQAGVGSATGNDFAGSETVFMPGIQADYETRRIFAAYRWHGIRGGPVKHQFNNAQAGFAFYAGEYDEWSPWFILDVRKMSNLDMDTQVTPTLRLIHKTLYVEAGAVDGKRLRVNLMYNFSF